MIGKQLPSIGWAVGIDRLSLLCNQSNIPSQTAIAIIHLNQPWAAYSLCDELRNHHITSIVITRPNLKKAIQLAQRSCDYMIVIGDEEIKTQQLIIKSLKQTQNHHVNYCVNDIVQIFKKITAINN